MQRAYARSGTGPSCQTAVLGLGSAARGVIETRVTGAQATAADARRGTPVRSDPPPDHATPAQPGRPVARRMPPVR
ncbi:hypothetical protein TPA0907_10470 [Micromonospora humidisoli]|nr:hypothetical protein TPA0907_10470 [Micromonospora sp. AKA109]